MKRFFFIITPARSWRKQQRNKRFGHDAFYGILSATWFFTVLYRRKKDLASFAGKRYAIPKRSGVLPALLYPVPEEAGKPRFL